MADRDDLGEGASPRRTIVGGRPPEDGDGRAQVPTGIQRLLRYASVDGRFREELLARRGAMADAANVELTASEKAILAAVPEAQLLRMIEGLPPPRAARREFLRQGAASAVILLGGAALVGSMTAGCPAEGEETEPSTPQAPPSPEEPAPPPQVPPEEKPPERPDTVPMPAGARPDEEEGPVEPPSPPPEERPQRPSPTRGIRPDIPPLRPAPDPWDEEG